MGSGASFLMVSPFDPGELADRVLQVAAPAQTSVARHEEPLEIQVTEILHQIGVPAHIKGYHYLRDSILMAVRNLRYHQRRDKAALPGRSPEI